MDSSLPSQGKMINLIDFSFESIQSSPPSDQNCTLKNDVSNNDINDMINDLIDQVEILSEDNCKNIIDESFHFENECLSFFDDKENICPEPNPRNFTPMDLTFKFLEVKVEQERNSRLNDQERILKEIHLDSPKSTSEQKIFNNDLLDNISFNDSTLNQEKDVKNISDQDSLTFGFNCSVFDQMNRSEIVEQSLQLNSDNFLLNTSPDKTNIQPVNNNQINKQNSPKVVQIEIDPQNMALPTANYDFLFENVSLENISDFSLVLPNDSPIIQNDSKEIDGKQIIVPINPKTQFTSSFQCFGGDTTNFLNNLLSSKLEHNETKDQTDIDTSINNSIINVKTSPTKSCEEEDNFEDAKDDLDQGTPDQDKTLNVKNASDIEEKSFSSKQDINLSIQKCDEISFSYSDRLDLLQTKISYENQIIDLQECLEKTRADSQSKQNQMDLNLQKIKSDYETSCRQYEEQINQLQINVTIFQEQLAEQNNIHQTTIAQLEETIQQKHCQINTFKHNEQLLMTQMNDLKQNNEKLLSHFYESQNEIEKLNEAILDMDQQRFKLGQTIDSLNSNIKDLKSQISDLTSERERLTNQFESERKQSQDEWQQKLTLLQNVNESLRLENKNIELKYETLIKDYQTNLQKCQQDRKDDETKFKKQIDNLVEINQNNQTLIDNLRKHSQELDEELKFCQHNFQNTQTILKEKDKQILSLKNDNQETESKMTQLHTKLIDSESNLSKLKAENEIITENNNRLQYRDKKNIEKISLLEEQIEMLKKQCSDLNEKNNQLKSEHNLLEDKLFVSEEKNVILESRLEQMEQKCTFLTTELQNKQSFFNDIQNLTSKLNEKEIQLEQIHEIHAEQRKILENQIEESKCSFEKLQSTYKTLLDQHENCLQNNQEQHSRLLEEMQNIQQERLNLLDRIQQKEKMIQRFEAQIEQNCIDIENYCSQMKTFELKFLNAQTMVQMTHGKFFQQKDVGQKLFNEINRLIIKVDGNKKDVIKNEKVKEILKLINEKVAIMNKIELTPCSEQDLLNNVQQKRKVFKQIEPTSTQHDQMVNKENVF